MRLRRLDCGEVLAAVVVAGCDSPELFEIVEESFDQVTLAIEREIGRSLDSPISLGRDDRGDSPPLKLGDERSSAS